MTKLLKILLKGNLFLLVCISSFSNTPVVYPQKESTAENYYLNRLKITQSDESKDYVDNKKQFQLHTLLTEQSHPATKNLSEVAKHNPAEALDELMAVDDDITHKVATLETDTETMAHIQQAVAAVKDCILKGNKIYVYGTGSTGRLAKQIENIWKDFWRDTQSRQDWPQIFAKLQDIQKVENIQDLAIGEITGADRALIRSLEGFEDLQLIGKLQLEDHKITAQDVVFAVTEGGETSAVIGTILSANKLPNSKATNLYFVYNNPDNLLMPFDRSREALVDPSITKINFTTGPQSITGSTRMQATTSQTFLIASIIEQALAEVLGKRLSAAQLHSLGFDPELKDVLGRLKKFEGLKKDLEKQKSAILKTADSEYQAYVHDHHAIYFGNKLLTTEFIDVTERAPTFNLSPLDPVNSPSWLSWIDIYTNASTLDQAWRELLFRDFQGLDEKRYKPAFEEGITDPYLKAVALRSLKDAGDDQKLLYDFSAHRLTQREYTSSDVPFAYLSVDEVKSLLTTHSPFRQWLEKFSTNNSTVILVGLENQRENLVEAANRLKEANPRIQIETLVLSSRFDPLQIQRKIALKLFLNLQSTLIMARLERVLGNSMIFVYPSNLKLTGRATFLSQLHINRILKSHFEGIPSIDYNQANAILFDAKEYIEKNNLRDKVAIIPLVIVRVFEALQNKPSTWEIAQQIVLQKKLSQYIEELPPLGGAQKEKKSSKSPSEEKKF